MATDEERAILENYSTPGLRKGELTRDAKRSQLDDLRLPKEDRDKILDELYPREQTP